MVFSYLQKGISCFDISGELACGRPDAASPGYSERLPKVPVESFHSGHWMGSSGRVSETTIPSTFLISPLAILPSVKEEDLV